MYHQVLGFLTSLILFIGFIPYLRDVLRGKTRPERASWLIWGILGSIAFASQYAEGASWSLLLPGIDTALGIIIFFLSIPYGTGGLAKRDIISLIIAGIGLLFWYFTDQPLLALLITIGIDMSGSWLTIVKTYEQPDSETAFAWVMSSLAGVPAALSVGSWSLPLLIYPLYIIVANGAVPVAARLGRGKRS
jgi:hypothetical protein